MLRKLTLISTLCLLTHPAFATEADFEKRMARGVAALETGDTTRAREEFSEAVREHPNDPEAALYLAIALGRANDPDAESALKAALRLEPGNPRTNLELGVYYYHLKMYDESGDYFENLLALQPEPDMKTAAEAYLANIRSRSGGKRWGITLAAGMQYDSNVPLAANKAQLPANNDRMGDWRGLINLGLSGIVYRDSSQELGANYSLYQTAHLHLSDFNLTQNLLDISYKKRFSPLLTAKVSAGVEAMQLGGEKFVNNYTISPAILIALDDRSSIGLDYRVRAADFKNSATYPTNSERDGTTVTINLNYRRQLSDSLNLRTGYTFDRDMTHTAAWGSDTHSASIGLGATLPYSLLLDVSCDMAGRRYDYPLAPATAIRADATIATGASLTWQTAEQYSITMGYHFTHNNSNIAGYDYDRNITSLMFQGRY